MIEAQLAISYLEDRHLLVVPVDPRVIVVLKDGQPPTHSAEITHQSVQHPLKQIWCVGFEDRQFEPKLRRSDLDSLNVLMPGLLEPPEEVMPER